MDLENGKEHIIVVQCPYKVEPMRLLMMPKNLEQKNKKKVTVWKFLVEFLTNATGI
jgi:hypothetical protein